MASTNRPLLSRLTLYNGMTIPQIQLGLFMRSGREATQAVHWALQAGYRGFDTAQMYGNEREAGRAIASFLSSRQENRENLRREDIHYTTKLMENGTSYDSVRRSIKDSVEACGLGYVDLFLLHSPYGGKEARLTSWRALEDAVESGEVRMIGVSNFGVRHVEELMASNPRIKPVVNQFEVHPFHTQMPIRKVCKKYDITVEAYAPFARGLRLKHPAVVELANKYSCTTSQLLVKWAMQHNMVTLPKSTRRERMISNVDVGGLQISEQDMRAMDNLDEGFISAWNPTNAA